MKTANKTKKELITELEALRERVSDLERQKINSRQAMGNFGERADRSFPLMAHLHAAMFVIFDRKFEFVNDRFAELFGVSSEEACSSNFDPLTLIAPESRFFIHELYQAGYRGSFAAKEFKYTGLSKDGLKIDCETFFLFIPYKWGVAIQGTLHGISVGSRIDEGLQRRHSELPIALSAVAPGVLHVERDRLLMQANETVGRSRDLPVEQIPRVEYLITLPLDAML